MTENKEIKSWIKKKQEFNEEILSDSNINKELGGNFENYLASADLENSKTIITKAIKNILEREREQKKN